jgi:hypothetical protein
LNLGPSWGQHHKFLIILKAERSREEGTDMTDIEPDARWRLVLYVNGASPKAVHAIEAVRPAAQDAAQAITGEQP